MARNIQPDIQSAAPANPIGLLSPCEFPPPSACSLGLCPSPRSGSHCAPPRPARRSHSCSASAMPARNATLNSARRKRSATSSANSSGRNQLLQGPGGRSPRHRSAARPCAALPVAQRQLGGGRSPGPTSPQPLASPGQSGLPSDLRRQRGGKGPGGPLLDEHEQRRHHHRHGQRAGR